MLIKINSYIGFAIKSRNIVFGVDNVLNSSKIKIIVASDDLSEGTIKKLQNKHKNTVILPQNAYITLNLQAKVFAITDKSLAEAIQKCI